MQPLALIAVVATLSTVPADSGELRGEALMDALRAGGYTILLRHARTPGIEPRLCGETTTAGLRFPDGQPLPR